MIHFLLPPLSAEVQSLRFCSPHKNVSFARLRVARIGSYLGYTGYVYTLSGRCPQKNVSLCRASAKQSGTFFWGHCVEIFEANPRVQLFYHLLYHSHSSSESYFWPEPSSVSIKTNLALSYAMKTRSRQSRQHLNVIEN